jgi:hypothetical protein
MGHLAGGLMSEIRLDDHYSQLVLPVVHDLPPEGMDLDRRWAPWWTRLDETEAAGVIDDAWFLIGPMRRTMFPEAGLLGSSGAPVDPEAARRLVKTVQQATASDLARIQGRLATADGAVTRLTFRVLEPVSHLTVERRGARFEIEVPWVDLVLFPDGIAFLVMRVALAEEAPTVARLRDTLAALRQVHKPAIDTPVAVLRSPHVSGDFELRDLADFLVADVIGDAPPADLEAFLRRPEVRYSEGEAGQTYGEVFRPWTWALLADAVPEADESSRLNDGLDEPYDRLLYDLATMSDSRDPDWAPAPAAVERRQRDHGLALWRSWSAMLLPQHCAFAGHSGSSFVRHVVSRNVAFDYFNVNLLVQYQKIRLTTLADEIARRRSGVEQLLAAREASRAFVTFRNRWWFAELSSRPQGEEIHQALRRGLGVESLFALVGEEVDDVREHFEEESTRRTNELIAALTVIAAPVTIWLAGLDALSERSSWIFVLVSTAVIFLLGLSAWYWRFRRPVSPRPLKLRDRVRSSRMRLLSERAERT